MPTLKSPANGPFFDLVVFGKTIHTMEDDQSQPTAIGIRDGVIAWVGDREDAHITPGTEVFDAEDGCITPGLVDAHIHPIMGLDMTRGVDLSDVTTLDDLHSRLIGAEFEQKATNENDWVLGWGLDPSIVEHRNLSATDLDEAVGQRPVFIRLFDGHSAVINTPAIERSGITGDERFASSSRVETDQGGAVTGFIMEWEAMQLVIERIPAAAFEDRLTTLMGVLSMMADTGLTGGQVLDWTDGMFELVRAAEQSGELPIKLWFAPWLMPADGQDRVQEALQLQNEHGRRWMVDGIKLMIDGTIDNGTAWLARPDVNGESIGPLWLDRESFTSVLHQCSAAGVRTTTHAIGDAGVRYVLDAIETAPHTTAEKNEELPRHRIEHIEMIPDELVTRFADLNVAASMQPMHCTLYCSGDGTDNWSRRLGDQRITQAWRLRSLRDAGVTVAVGSDWPIAPCAPLRTMADAQLRREAGQNQQIPVVADEALTALQVLEGYTTHQARSWGWEKRGRITPGEPADLSLFSQDILKTSPDSLPNVTVVATVVDGIIRRPAKKRV